MKGILGVGNNRETIEGDFQQGTLVFLLNFLLGAIEQLFRVSCAVGNATAAAAGRQEPGNQQQRERTNLTKDFWAWARCGRWNWCPKQTPFHPRHNQD